MKRGIPLDVYQSGVGETLGTENQASSEQQRYWPAFEDMLPDSADRVLDFGCGNGFYTAQLANKYPSAVILGADAVASQMPSQASGGTGNPRYIEWDGQSPLAVPQPFDLIVAKMVLHYMSDDQLRALGANLNRLLAPGGIVAFSVPHPYDSKTYNTKKRTEWDRRHTPGIIHRAIGHTGIEAAMFHRDFSTWVNWLWPILKQNERYDIALDEVEDDNGNMKRLNVTYAPSSKREIIDGIYQRINAHRPIEDPQGILVDPNSPYGREVLYGDISHYPTSPLP